jgi:hypothetical protein
MRGGLGEPAPDEMAHWWLANEFPEAVAERRPGHPYPVGELADGPVNFRLDMHEPNCFGHLRVGQCRDAGFGRSGRLVRNARTA